MRRIMILLAALSLGAAACGDSKTNRTASSSVASDSRSTTEQSTTEQSSEATPPVSLAGTTNAEGDKAVSGGTIEIELSDEFYFEPTFVKVTKGETVKVHVHNTGKLPHTFTSAPLAVDVLVDPGAEKDLTVTVKGATEFHCRFHQSSGMQGAFYVQAGDTVSS